MSFSFAKFKTLNLQNYKQCVTSLFQGILKRYRTTYNVQRTTYNLQLTTYNLQLTTYNLQLTTYNLRLINSHAQNNTLYFQ